MTENPEVFRKYDIRGEVPEEVNSEIVYKVGKALGRYWKNGEIVVGRDHRNSSKTFQNAMISGLSSQGIDITFIGLATTDLTAYAAMKDFDGGVMLTASHMPSSYGGIKPLNSAGRILSNDEMQEVKKLYGDIEDQKYGEISSDSYRDEYLESAAERYHELIDEEPGKVVLDPGNGVGSLLLPDLLEQLGAEVIIVNGELDSDFPSRSPEPREDNLEELADKVVEEGADIGIALDGDADRALFVDENGNTLSGDESLAILSEKYLEHTDEVVTSLNSSEMLEEVAGTKNSDVRHVPVGAVFTALECLDSDAGFGGQPNGHLMDPELVPYDSGTLLGAVMAGIGTLRPLSSIRKDLPDYQMKNWNLETDEKYEVIKNIRKRAEEREWLKGDRYDTLRIDTGQGTAVIRPSGSEPVIRVRIESKDSINSHEECVRSLIRQKEKK